MKKRRGVYPGTFDPFTNGHCDIIRRAAATLVDELIIAVAPNPKKEPLFSLEERLTMVRGGTLHLGGGVRIQPLEGLLIHFAQKMEAPLIIRGLRSASDFEYESQLSRMNAQLSPSVETVFLMTSSENQCISSQLVKEVCQLGGDVRKFVHPCVHEKLMEVFKGVGA